MKHFLGGFGEAELGHPILHFQGGIQSLSTSFSCGFLSALNWVSEFVLENCSIFEKSSVDEVGVKSCNLWVWKKW